MRKIEDRVSYLEDFLKAHTEDHVSHEVAYGDILKDFDARLRYIEAKVLMLTMEKSL